MQKIPDGDDSPSSSGSDSSDHSDADSPHRGDSYLEGDPRDLRRECDRFSDPCGLRSRVSTGSGMGWHITTLIKPVPVVRV